MLEMKHGRPETNEGRLDKEIRAYDLLDSLGVEFDRIDHAAAMTMDDCLDVDEALCAVICKNLFLCNRQKTKFYLLMIPSEKKFKTKDLSALLGVARLSFGKAEYMEDHIGEIYTGIISGVTEFGLFVELENTVEGLVKSIYEIETSASICPNDCFTLYDEDSGEEIVVERNALLED